MRANLSNFFSTTLAFTIAAIATPASFAQDDLSLNAQHVPYSSDFIREAVAASSESLAVDGMAIVPESILLELSLRKLLRDPRYYHVVDPKDWRYLNAIPSRNDDQFLWHDLNELEHLCEDFASSDDDVVVFAAVFDELRRQSEKAIGDHYKAIIEKLSPSTRTLLSGIQTSLSQKGRMGYSHVNLAGLAVDAPVFVERLLNGKCESVKQQVEEYSLRKITLRDERPISIPIGVLEGKNFVEDIANENK